MFDASWNIENMIGELTTLYCINDKCTKSDKYQIVTIIANLQLKSCLIKMYGWSSPGGFISTNTGGEAEGRIENNICTYSTSIGYTIRGAKIESIYGETKTFGDW